MSNYTKQTLENIWNNTLDKLKAGAFFDDSIYNTYINDSKLYDINMNGAIVLIKNFVARSVFENNRAIFENTLGEVLDQTISITFALKKDIKDYTELNEESKRIIIDDKLLDKYTFENSFI